MFIVAWSINHGGNKIEDFWVVHETKEDAEIDATKLLDIGNLHCWAIAEIKSASEPHWME